jgi:hypothetical protein
MAKDSANTAMVTSRGSTVKALIDLLNGGYAHASFENAVSDIPAKMRGITPEGLPYSLWQLVEHIRIAQWDILEFSRNEKYESPVWPDEYWPEAISPSEAVWKDSLSRIKKDKKEFIALLQDPARDLYAPFPYGDGQNLIREAMLIADHTSYHTGEIIVLRRVLGIW